LAAVTNVALHATNIAADRFHRRLCVVCSRATVTILSRIYRVAPLGASIVHVGQFFGKDFVLVGIASF